MNWFKKKEREKRWQVIFNPTQDISTYELARCLKWYILVLSHPQIDGKSLKKRFDESLPDNIKRHFDWSEL